MCVCLGVMQCEEYAHDTLLRIIRSVCARPALHTTEGRLAATWIVYIAMVES